MCNVSILVQRSVPCCGLDLNCVVRCFFDGETINVKITNGEREGEAFLGEGKRFFFLCFFSFFVVVVVDVVVFLLLLWRFPAVATIF